MQKGRVEYIDVVKGFAIIAIIYRHIQFVIDVPAFVSYRDFVARSWDVPIFFLIAGFFVREVTTLVEWGTFLLRKIKQLYLPALFFYVPAVLMHNYFCSIGWYGGAAETEAKFLPYDGFAEVFKHLVLTVFCAGREPILGPLWFVYVLLFAMVGYSGLNLLLNKLGGRQYMLAILAVSATVSAILTNVYDITINRFSNVFVAMLLIDVGRNLYQRLRLEFDSTPCFFLSIVLLYEMSVLSGGCTINSNRYSDVVLVAAASVAALYVLAYLAKRYEGSLLMKFAGWCGRESFYIMTLHLTGFKLLTELALLTGNGVSCVSSLEAQVGGSVMWLAMYLLAGILFPMMCVAVFRKLQGGVLSIIKK